MHPSRIPLDACVQPQPAAVLGVHLLVKVTVLLFEGNLDKSRGYLDDIQEVV